MMKQNRSIFIGWQGVVLALAVVLYGLLELAYCQDPISTELQPRIDGTVLLLQQIPLEGGEVNPRVGVHRFELDAEVTLTAVSKPGYYFVYWIGDVSDPTANSTIVYLDTPKIVIAVFERSEFEFEEKRLQNTLGIGGRLRRSAGDYARRGGGGAVRYEYEGPRPPTPPEEEPIPEPELPVPEEGEVEANFPVPELPEPATVCLLALGSLALLRNPRFR